MPKIQEKVKFSTFTTLPLPPNTKLIAKKAIIMIFFFF